MIEIMESDRQNAIKEFESAPSIKANDAIVEYKKEMDNFCKEYNASSYHELITRADDREFSNEVNIKILNCYSMLNLLSA